MTDFEKILLSASITLIVSLFIAILAILVRYFFFDKPRWRKEDALKKHYETKAQKLHEEKMKLEDQKLKKLDEEIAETKKQTQLISEQKEKIKEEAEF